MLVAAAVVVLHLAQVAVWEMTQAVLLELVMLELVVRVLL
jgi:hypothetical protein